MFLCLSLCLGIHVCVLHCTCVYACACHVCVAGGSHSPQALKKVHRGFLPSSQSPPNHLSPTRARDSIAGSWWNRKSGQPGRGDGYAPCSALGPQLVQRTGMQVSHSSEMCQSKGVLRLGHPLLLCRSGSGPGGEGGGPLRLRL